MTKLETLQKELTELYSNNIDALSAHDSVLIKEHRGNAFENFKKLGFE